MSNHQKKTVYLTVTAVMTAVATVIYMVFPEIPLVPGVEYLKMDFSDIPAIATGIMINPAYGVAVEVIKNLIHLFRTSTFGIGEIINVGIGAALICGICGFSSLFSKLFSKKKMSPAVYYSAAVLTLALCVLTGWALNAIFTPVFFKIMGIPITSKAVLAGVWGSTLLNVVKSALNLLPFYPVYFALKKITSDKISVDK